MNKQSPLVIFREEFDELTAFEVESKGWYSGITVELENKNTYQLFFYDPIRLHQDLEADSKPYISEPGLVVVPRITVENINMAVKGLYNEGFFNYLQPIGKNT